MIDRPVWLSRQAPPRKGKDQEPDQSADQRAVDADVLQVLADLQLEPVDQCGGVPGLHHIGDEGADLGAARRNRAGHQVANPPVDLHLERLVFPQPPPGAQQAVFDAGGDRLRMGGDVGRQASVDFLPTWP